MRNTLLIRLIGGSALFLALSGPGQPAAQGPNALEKAASNVIAATLSYQAALERLLGVYERDLARRQELAELRRDLFEREVLSKREFEEGERAQAEARKNVEETRAALIEADRMLIEARVAEALARLTPLPRGKYEETPGLARFNGMAPWPLAVDAPRLQQFFLARFGRALPVSAYGQTALHDRMGFDHRNALDLAVHPDSPEGRAVMEHLRARGHPVHRRVGADSGVGVWCAYPRGAAFAADLGTRLLSVSGLESTWPTVGTSPPRWARGLPRSRGQGVGKTKNQVVLADP